MLLENKVAIVTGGTRGIGYATVKEFLKQGAKVALFGSREETVRVALEKLREENPDYPVIGLYPNLMDANEVKEAFQKVVHEFGHLDVLVNNAGISQRDKIFDYNIEDFEKIMNLNVNAVFVCSKEAAHNYERTRMRSYLKYKLNGFLYMEQPAGAGYPHLNLLLME